MFNRVLYKKTAKEQLKGRWKTCIIVTLISTFVFYLMSAPSFIEEIREKTDKDFEFGDILEASFSNFTFTTKYDFSNLIYICISGIIMLAYFYFFVQMYKRKEPLPFAVFLRGLSFYIKGILGILWNVLWVALWALLFIFPAIVKAYSYSMMFEVLADNPAIGVRKAMNISKELTRGHKSDLFIMDMSFLPWLILVGITFGLAGLYVMPYIQMSQTNAYFALKEMALRSGRLTKEDFEVESTNERYNESSYRQSESDYKENTSYSYIEKDRNWPSMDSENEPELNN